MVTTARPEPAGGSSLVALRWYLPLRFAANLACETAQLPLYTLWRESSPKEIAVIEAGLAPLLAMVRSSRPSRPLAAPRSSERRGP
jgi:hypothetical protein